MKHNDIIYKRVQDVQKLKRSFWGRGVCSYACMIIDNANEGLVELNLRNVEDVAKCGAISLGRASWGGSYLISNEDIARLLATPSELKSTCYGVYKPNKREEWLDTQARALYQAVQLIKEVIRGL